MRTKTLIVALLPVLLSYSADATTIRVPEDYPTIQQALAVAVAGDTVLVGPGVWTTGYQGYQMVDGVTLASSSGAKLTEIGAIITVDETVYETVIEGFTFTRDGIQIYCDGGSPIIRYNVFEVDSNCQSYTTTTGVRCWDGASPWIEGNTFRGWCTIPESDAYGVASDNSSPIVIDNEFLDREYGVRLSGASSAGRVIENSLLNSWVGIICDDGVSDTVRSNQFVGCTAAIRCGTGAPSILSNIISGSLNEAFLLIGAAVPVLRKNAMSDNRRNIRLGFCSDAVTVDARENWWGTIDEAGIAALIEVEPTAEGCSVEFDPWCLDPQCESTAVVPSSWGCIKKLYLSSPR